MTSNKLRVSELVLKGRVAIKKALETQQQKYFEEALKKCNAALVLNNTNPEIWSCLGDALLYQKSYAGAIESYQKAIELEPTCIDIRKKLAYAYMKAGFYAQAEKEAKRLLEETPNNLEARLTLGECYMAFQKPQEAKHMYASIINDPNKKRRRATGWIDLFTVRRYNRESEMLTEKKEYAERKIAYIGILVMLYKEKEYGQALSLELRYKLFRIKSSLSYLLRNLRP